MPQKRSRFYSDSEYPTCKGKSLNEILPRVTLRLPWAKCCWPFKPCEPKYETSNIYDQKLHLVVHELECHGWRVQNAYLDNPMRHDKKCLLINQGAAGKLWLMSYFNRQNNDGLILVIQFAGVECGRNGFRRNKSTEKNPESEEDLLEHRTDGTDAFDTLYIGGEKFPQHDFYGGFVGRVR